MFSQACQPLQLEDSIADDFDEPGREALLRAKGHMRLARKMAKKAARATRKAAKQGEISRACRKSVLGKIKNVKKAIPRGKRLRRCFLR